MKIIKNVLMLVLLSNLNLLAMEEMHPQLSSNNIYGSTAPTPIENTILIWDLDDVVLEKHMKWIVASYLVWPRVLYRTNTLQKELKKLIGSGAAAEGIVTYAKAKGDKAVAQFVADVANTKTLNPDVAQIIKDVHARGIKEYIASNMGQEGYAHIMEGTNNADTEISALFTENFTGIPQLVDYSQVTQLAKNPEAKVNILKKPNPEFFTQFFAKNNIDPKKVRSIFIDDKLDNVKGFLKAAGENATGIVFKDYGELRSDLEALKVLVKQNSEALKLITE